MQLYFKQRLFSWFDSYDIYNAADGSVAFTVEGQLAWGHCLHILDPQGRHIATVQQRVLTFLPKFDLYVGERCIGQIRKEFTLFRPSFVLDGLGWDTVDGALIDIGVSSLQIDSAERGFSFNADGPLDMRMDRDSGDTPVSRLVNRAKLEELKDIIERYGEDPQAGGAAPGWARSILV